MSSYSLLELYTLIQNKPDGTTLSGVGGIVTTMSGEIWFIDGSNIESTGDVTLEMLTTTSGDIIDYVNNSLITMSGGTMISGTNGILAVFDNGTWLISGQELIDYINLEIITLSGYTEALVDDRCTTLSGINGIDAYYTTEDGVWWINGAALQQQITTTSGDIVAQIPSLAGYATQIWVNNNFISTSQMTTISGDIIAQIGGGEVTLEMLTTTSGDIVAQIGEGEVTLEQLVTTSGDIIDYVDNNISSLSGTVHTELDYYKSALDLDAIEVIATTAPSSSYSYSVGTPIINLTIPAGKWLLRYHVHGRLNYSAANWLSGEFYIENGSAVVSGTESYIAGTVDSAAERQEHPVIGSAVVDINEETTYTLRGVKNVDQASNGSLLCLGMSHTPPYFPNSNTSIEALRLDFLGGGNGDVTLEMLTTTSGDIVAQIGAGEVTLEQLTTTSGDIISQIPSLAGYATESWVDSGFISNSEMTTISGDVVNQIYPLEGTGGIEASLVGSTWYIDGSNIEGTGTGGGTGSSAIAITGSGNFAGSTGTTINHDLGSINHFIGVTPGGSENELADSTKIGQVWVQLGTNIDTVYNSDDAGIGLPFSWMVLADHSVTGPILTGSGTFTASGTSFYHGLESLDHYTDISLCGAESYDSDALAMVGATYIEKGLYYDTVYTQGAGDAEGFPFSWLVTVSGGGETVLSTITATSGTFTDGLSTGNLNLSPAGIQFPGATSIINNSQISAMARAHVGGRIDIYDITSSGTGTQLYWNPVIDAGIGLYNGTEWRFVTPTGGIYLNQDATTISGATMSGGVNYDVFAEYLSDDSFQFVIQEWYSDTVRWSPLVQFEGVYVNGLDAARKKRRFIGTVRRRSTYNKEFVDAWTERFVSNYYNQVDKKAVKGAQASGATFNNTASYELWTNWVSPGLQFVLSTDMAVDVGGSSGTQNGTSSRALIKVHLDGIAMGTDWWKDSWGSYGDAQQPMIETYEFTVGYHYLDLYRKLGTGSSATAHWQGILYFVLPC